MAECEMLRIGRRNEGARGDKARGDKAKGVHMKYILQKRILPTSIFRLPSTNFCRIISYLLKNYFTNPEKPINASESNPAVIKVRGKPFIPFG